MSSQESLISRTAVFLLCISFLITTVLQVASCSNPDLEGHLQVLNRTNRQAGSGCEMTMGKLTVYHDGCNAKVLKNIPMCGGQCNSHTFVTLDPPYSKQNCSCCAASKFSIIERDVRFKCGPDGKKEKHPVFYTEVEECNCVLCSGSLL